MSTSKRQPVVVAVQPFIDSHSRGDGLANCGAEAVTMRLLHAVIEHAGPPPPSPLKSPSAPTLSSLAQRRLVLRDLGGLSKTQITAYAYSTYSAGWYKTVLWAFAVDEQEPIKWQRLSDFSLALTPRILSPNLKFSSWPVDSVTLSI
ncbi:hypothetical protein B0T11DRAFT_294344 [Plectosphaerella cucumerina]|uniref:Uncharacterized protein n=1 Tax=Plectosphaerella cucumerina TaxID=40658 RepID=A0A8K0TR97_9PEZI|nr:hypothetical protein B0T11DRAFT_294344 [Plectosphaerella cucumerina]